MSIARSSGCSVDFLQNCYGAGKYFRRRNDRFDAVVVVIGVVIRLKWFLFECDYPLSLMLVLYRCDAKEVCVRVS